MSVTTVPRISYTDAMRAVLQELANGIPMSISSLSKKLNIDRRTISKVIDMLIEIQDVLAANAIETERIGRRFIIKFKERTAKARQKFSAVRTVTRRIDRRRNANK